MYNFAELKEKVGVIVQRSGDSDYLDKIGVWVNLSIDHLYHIYDYYPELEGSFRFTTVDGTEDYYMPSNFYKPLRVYDRTNKKKLSIKDELSYRDSNISSIIDGDESTSPSIIRFYGVKGISADGLLSTGTIVQVKSSSLSDNDSPIVRIEGYVDSAKTVLDFEDITINTVTPTTFTSGTKTFYDILHVSKSKDTTGYITVADSAETTLAILSSIDRVLYHRIAKLGLIPSQANVMEILYKKKITRLVDDNDYPFIDADDFIILNSVGYAYSQDKETTDKSQSAWQKASSALNVLLNDIQNSLGPDFQHKIIPGIAQAHRS